MYTYVVVDVEYDGDTYKATFYDWGDRSAEPVKETISTSASSGDLYVGDWQYLNFTPHEIQMQTSHRQDSDP